MFMVAGQIFRKPVDPANILLKHYIEKVSKMIGGLKRSGRDPLNFLSVALQKWDEFNSLPTFSLREISVIETLDLMKKLGNTTATGLDGLDALMLKLAVDELKWPITYMINTSIRMTTFTSKWKISKIILHLKSKDASGLDPASYHPVGPLPTVSKLVERAVQVQLQNHLETTGILSQNSHMYRQNLSTATAILQVVDKIQDTRYKMYI